MAKGTLVLIGLFPTFLICTDLVTSQTTDNENGKCFCNIPGTKLYADVYYEIRLVHSSYPGWPLTYSSPTDKMHGMVAIDPSENETLMRNGQSPASLHWRFVEAEKPGWYYLQNKNHLDMYITWGVEEGDKLLYSGWRLVLDPNFAEEHYNRMDFFVRPYRPKGVDIYIHQLKFKNLPLAVVSWSSWRDKGSTDVPIQLDMNDQQYLRHYEHGNKYFQDTLFEFREVKENVSATSTTSTFSWPLFTLLCVIVESLAGILTIFWGRC